jgi:hypothetical protein
MKEQKRIAKKKEQILNALRNAGEIGITNAQLSKIALRYGGHLGKLYEEGYKIDKESLGDGLYNYTLVSEPETIIIREKALDVLLSQVKELGSVSSEELYGLLNVNNISVKYKANTYK